MGRILNNHSAIHTFPEIHFFEQLWSRADNGKILSEEKATLLASRLLNISREGYFAKLHLSDFLVEAKSILKNEPLTAIQVYKKILEHETFRAGKKIIAKQTPQNVFYISEIMENIPDAKFIFMVRDARSVLLSQKNKWRRKFLGGTHAGWHETIRAWFNYHPYTISKLWNASFNAGAKWKSNQNVLQIKFEDLVSNPETIVKSIGTFIGVDFQTEMLNIPKLGSSLGKDLAGEKGIRTDRAESWKNGALTSAEISICEKVCGENLKALGYELSNKKINPLAQIYYFILFPLKTCGAFLLNLHRMKNIRETLRKRFGK